MSLEEAPHEIDDRFDRMIGKLSLWMALLLATAGTYYYYSTNPPDTEEVQRMRIFFRENAIPLGEFFKMPIEKQQAFARKQDHPFYKSYMKASTIEKEKIRANYHLSIDYKPSQYWFTLAFSWALIFLGLWFIGLMIQGVVNLVRAPAQNK